MTAKGGAEPKASAGHPHITQVGKGRTGLDQGVQGKLFDGLLYQLRTGLLKKGNKSVGVQSRYSGKAGD